MFYLKTFGFYLFLVQEQIMADAFAAAATHVGVEIKTLDHQNHNERQSLFRKTVDQQHLKQQSIVDNDKLDNQQQDNLNTLDNEIADRESGSVLDEQNNFVHQKSYVMTRNQQNVVVPAKRIENNVKNGSENSLDILKTPAKPR